MSAIKRDTDDALYSTLIREGACWTCQYPECSRYFPEGERAGLHASHIMGRRRAATRHDPDNALALCRYHHKFVGEFPLIHAALVQDKLGHARYQALILRGNSVLKLTAQQKAARRRHLRSELDIMLQRRANGETGPLTFKPFDPAEYDSVVGVKPRKPKKRLSKYKRKVDGSVVKREAA